MTALFIVLTAILACFCTSFAVAPAAEPPTGKKPTDDNPDGDGTDAGGESDEHREPPADDEEELPPTVEDMKAAVQEDREANEDPPAKPEGKKPTPTPKPESNTEVDDEDSELDEALLKRATDAGMNPERAKSLSRDALEAALDVVDRQMLDYGRNLRTGDNKPPEKKDPPPPEKKDPPKAPAASSGEPPRWPERIEKINFDELVDASGTKINLKEEMPETHAALTKMQDAFHSHLDRIHQAVTGLLQSHFESQETSLQGKFDGMISGLGESYAEALGKGATAELPANSPGLLKRQAIVEAMGDLNRGYLQRTGKAPKFETLFQRAVDMTLADHNKKIARKDAGKRVEDRQKQFTSRPSHHQPRPQSKENKAMDVIIEKLGEIEQGD
jgi:hypothetical protein